MPSLYGPWSGKSGKKKKVAFPSQTPMQSTIDKAMRKAAIRRNGIIFKNIPSHDHISRKVREKALEQHHQWEESLTSVPITTLHFTCNNLQDYAKLPRQTCAWLIAKYCNDKNVTMDTLSQSITKSNGNIKNTGLMWRRDTDERPCVNLHALDSETMYRVYCSIPDDHRPAAKPLFPKEERPPREPKASKKRSQPGGLPKAQAPVVVEEQFTWVQCDKCEKWRRLFNTTEEELPEQWLCTDHPDEITCDVAEDTMDAEEQWDGKTKGTILKISFSNGNASVRVVDAESQSTGQPESSDDDEPASSSSGPINEGGSKAPQSSDGFVMNGDTDLSEIDDDTGGGFAEDENGEEDVDDAVENLFGSEDDDEDEDEDAF